MRTDWTPADYSGIVQTGASVAYVETSFRANDGSGPMVHYMNVTEAVGTGCPNRPDDVALIQTFLNSLGNLPESPVQGSPSPVDGRFSVPLARGICLFQSLVRKVLRRRQSGETIVVDGLILPARGVYVEGLRMYTIVALNKAYAHYYWHDYLQKYPLVQAEAVSRLERCALQLETDASPRPTG